MKKVLSLLFVVILIALITGGILVYQRYRSNPEQIVPLPYTFESASPSLVLDAPILIAGDRMGVYFSKFKEELAATISANLDKAIKIQSVAKEGNALHRSLHELRSLNQWPQILIYHGGSEEFLETKFEISEIKKINTNFRRYADERVETALMLYPELSRFIYEPLQRVKLPPTAVVAETLSEEAYLRRLETEILLFEQHLKQLAVMSKDRNTLLILTTTPVNLDIPPKRACGFTSTIDIDKEILELRKLLKENNPKGAYTRSTKLIEQYAGNPELMFIHGQIAARLGVMEEAVDSLLKASAYDCEPWRASELQNSIIRKVAKDHQVLLFDFAKLLEKEYPQGTTFFDELHPQNLYYEQGMKQLGMVIKSILKL